MTARRPFHSKTLTNMTEQVALHKSTARLLHRLEELKRESANLFNKRDEMLTYEYPRLYSLYLTEIGQLKYEEFSLQTEVKILSLRLSLIQAYINSNKAPDFEAIEEQIRIEKENYQKILEEKMADIKAAKEYMAAPLMTPEESREMKAIYVLLVKKLHPDINPNQPERHTELFLKAVAAYKTQDLATLRQILLMVDTDSVEDLPADTLEDQIEKLEKTVESIRQRIAELEASFPFDLRDKIYNKEWVAEQQNLLKESINALTVKKQSLEQILMAYRSWKPESLS